MLLPAFNTTHGLPMYAVNTVSYVLFLPAHDPMSVSDGAWRRGETRPGWTGSDILWAEALSCQVEYKYLAHLTGRKEYFDAVSDHTHPASLLSRLKERPRDRSSA